MKKNTNIKKNLDICEVRRKREDNIIELRKAKREEILSKRRSFEDDDESNSMSDKPLETDLPNLSDQLSLTDLPRLIEMIHSGSTTLQYNASQGFRKLLSIEKHPPIDDVIKTGVVPRLVEFLSFTNEPKIQFESAWALTNIASGTEQQTRFVIDHGAVPALCQLLKNHEIEIREQAVWALGNISGDSPTCRDIVIRAGVLAPILDMINPESPLSLLRNCTWTLSNFCRGHPQPRFETVSAALPALAALLYSNDTEILTDACWALSYLSDGTDEKIQEVIDTDISSRLIELLRHSTPAVHIPALRTAGNIVTGDDDQTEIMINAGILPCLNEMLTNSVKSTIRKEACWTISNITAGSLSQIQNVIRANIIPLVVHMLATAEFSIQKEAAWAISNATSVKHKGKWDSQVYNVSPEERAEVIEHLILCGCIPPMCEILACKDVEIISIALEGLDNILKISSSAIELVDECGGLDKIEALQQHRHDEIRSKAVSISLRYDKYITPHNGWS